MEKTLGIILAYSDRENLRELTKNRTLASLPIGGKYRIADFTLSNFVNCGIHDVSYITQSNYHSLMDHLGAGLEWDLIRKRGGLRVLTPYAMPGMSHVGLYRGYAEALSRNMHSIWRSMADYVIISGSCILYSMDFRALVQSHIERNADITVVYTRPVSASRETVPLHLWTLKMDRNDKIYDMEINKDDTVPSNAPFTTGVFVIRKSLLESLLADAMALGKYDWYADILHRLLNSLHIVGHEYTGHLMEISTVTGYMQANMRFLDPEFRKQVFREPVYTKAKDSVPVKYENGCKVKNSLISDGCHIEGTVENSVISRGVHIGKGAVVKNCVIMQNTEVVRNANLEHVILDKDVIVRESRRLSGHESYPVVVEKSSIV